jgi:hypothetical protein
MGHTPSPQLTLPYTADDFISDRVDLDGFPHATDPLAFYEHT